MTKVGKYIFGGDNIHKSPTDGKRILVIDETEKIPEGTKGVVTFPLVNGEQSLAAYTFNL